MACAHLLNRRVGRPLLDSMLQAARLSGGRRAACDFSNPAKLRRRDFNARPGLVEGPHTLASMIWRPRPAVKKIRIACPAPTQI